MEKKLKKCLGFLLGSALLCTMVIFAAPVRVSAAGATLHVDTAASYTTVPERTDGKAYRSIQDALSKAASGDTIMLDSDVAAGVLSASSPYKIPKGVTLTLDLNGKKITATDEAKNSSGADVTFYLFENRGDFTVTDTAGGGEITLENSKAWNSGLESAALMNQGGTLTVAGGKISSKGSKNNMAYAVDNLASSWNGMSATCNITGGELISSYNCIRLFNMNAKCSTNLTVTGGRLHSSGVYSPIYLQEYPDHGSTGIKISGGSFDADVASAKLRAAIYWLNYAKEDTVANIEISGGTFGKNLTSLLNYWDDEDSEVANYGTVRVSGGTFEAAPYSGTEELNDLKKMTASNTLDKYTVKNVEIAYEEYNGIDCFVVLGAGTPAAEEQTPAAGATTAAATVAVPKTGDSGSAAALALLAISAGLTAVILGKKLPRRARRE
jgi:hypothetical protein